MKTVKVLALAAGILTFGIANAQAVPTIDGTASGSEWANAGYPYYLTFSDPNEALIPDDWDIENVVLFQELDAFGGDGNPANDGIYLLIEAYGDATLVDHDAPADVPPYATVNMSGDFNGDGVNDIFVTHDGGNKDGTAQQVLVANPAGGIPHPGIQIGAGCNSGGGCGTFAEGSVLEYFLPTGAYGTPPGVPFPQTFKGTIIYDNGGTPPDDITIGSLPPGQNVIPEPGTMFLLGSGLLGLVGLKKKKTT